MKEYNADFHLHGPRSIGVSKDLDLPNLVHGARQKGLSIVATGDCLQPDWLAHLKSNLEIERGIHQYKGPGKETGAPVYFILQTEVEDNESVHQILLFPDFDAIARIKARFRAHSPNLDHEWGGRPRVNLSPEEIVEIATDEGVLVGPAHAFTPFKSIFRQGKFESLQEAYGNQARNVHFIELGLSANSEYADSISELHRLTFMSNSDAHSPTPVSLGREFNTVLLDEPSFEEIDMAITRKNGRRFTRNVGFDPRLGKYNVLFCKACRRRILLHVKPSQKDAIIPVMMPPKMDEQFITMKVHSEEERRSLLERVSRKAVTCPACAKEKKNSKLYLGVSDRVELMADSERGLHPAHRSPYINTVPLTEMLRVAMGLASAGSKTLIRIYNDIISLHGPEIDLLLHVDLKTINLQRLQEKFKRYSQAFSTLVEIIRNFRTGNIEFKPGGGGTFGELLFES